MKRRDFLWKLVLCFGIGFFFSTTPVWATIQGTTIGELKESNGILTFEYDNPELLMPESITNKKAKSTVLPTTFDLGDMDTTVKNQYQYGTCWALSSIESLQSNLIVKGKATTDIDLSERHLVWFAYNGKNDNPDASSYAGGDTFSFTKDIESPNEYQAGGGRWLAVPTLARWYGVVDESEAPYDNITIPEDGTMIQDASAIHLSDANYLPEPSGDGTSEAINIIKTTLMNNGAIAVNMFYDKEHFKEDVASYCPTNEGANHGVTIVGWDDNYAIDHFNEEPPGKGAWKIKNSWGEESNDQGYFWLSYYDKSFSNPTSYIAEGSTYDGKNTKHQYKNIYQYDGVGVGENIVYSPLLTKVSNTFTARGDEKLEAIGTNTPTANTKVKIEVYLDSGASNPTQGRLLTTKETTCEFAGFHTISLDEQIYFKKGDTFTVVMTSSMVKGAQTYYAISAEASEISDGNSRVSIETTPNVSSIYQNGEWQVTTASTRHEYYNIRFGNSNIKAYTTNSSATESATGYGESLAKEITAATTPGTQTYSGKSKVPNVTVKSDSKTLAKGTDYTLTYSNNKTCGKATVKITGKGNYTGTLYRYFRIIPKKGSISKLTAGKKKIKVKIKANSGKISGYQIGYKKKGKKYKKYKYKITSKTTKTLNKLSRKKKYYVKVRVYKTIDGKRYYGKWSTKKTKKTK